jgi:1-acyl-sn-glycerol-3-phosphate acyltransferase
MFLVLPKRWRYRIAPAMYKEYFRPHFSPEEYSRVRSALSSLQYFLTALLANAFPIPQEESGVRDTLRYAGDLVSDGWSLLIYPEGERRPGGQMGAFQPGVGLMAIRLKAPVVPMRIEGTDAVLPPHRVVVRPGRTRVTFGRPMFLQGEDPRVLAHQVESAVRAL